MPVVYIHGVNTRAPDQGRALGAAFERWLGPKLGGDFSYFPIFWGDLVAQQFRWNLDSRPRTMLRYAGAGEWTEQVAAARDATNALLSLSAAQDHEDDIVLGGAYTSACRNRLAAVAPRLRGDLAADLYLVAQAAQMPDGEIDAREIPPGLALAADRVADEWAALVNPGRGDEVNAREIVYAVQRHLDEGGTEELLAAGALANLGSRAKEALSRLVSLPGDALSTLAAEGRPAANGFVANFLGDVLTYLHTRGDRKQPGDIVLRVLDGLKDAHKVKAETGQPLVVLTHSMGGQLLLDAVNYYAEGDPELVDLQIDHWFTCGSQCSFFAELGLFQEQQEMRSPGKLPRPPRVAKWTNFYDLNDFVSFVMTPVFDGVDDVEYNTGCGLIAAHTSYLTRPSFFQLLANRL